MTLLLTGHLPAILLISAVLTAVASALLAWWYRRATLATMRSSAAPRAGADERGDMPAAVPRPAPDSTLTIRRFDRSLADRPGVGEPRSYATARRALARTGLVHVTGGLGYAVVVALPWQLATGDGFVLGRFAWLTTCYLWPTVVAMAFVYATTPGDTRRVFGVYAALVTAVGGLTLWRNPDLGIVPLGYLWLLANGPATLLLLGFVHRRVRSIGPLVLPVAVAGVAGAVALVELARRDDRVLGMFVDVGLALGLGTAATFALMLLTGLAVFGTLGGLALAGIGRLYRAKVLSDQAIVMDAAWLTYAIVQPITFAFENPWWVLAGPAGFAVYKLTTRIGFRWFAHDAPENPPMLLLLRVFALGRRSEALFDTFSMWWRRTGPIALICGPDLVTTGLEPHEFLDFLGGRHARRFVRDADDLDRRLAAIDRRADPDGRFRVNELFCHADNWRLSVRRLAARSRAVLMDLRRFSPDCPGCVFEIGLLLDTVELDRVVFVVDETTDIAFLTTELERLWANVDPASPNRAGAAPLVRLFDLAHRDRATVRALYHLLDAPVDPEKKPVAGSESSTASTGSP